MRSSRKRFATAVTITSPRSVEAAASKAGVKAEHIYEDSAFRSAG